MDKSIDRDPYTCTCHVLVHGNRVTTHLVGAEADRRATLLRDEWLNVDLARACAKRIDDVILPHLEALGLRGLRRQSPTALADEHEHEHVSRGRVRTTEIDRVVHSLRRVS
jgi:hypothetical protein